MNGTHFSHKSQTQHFQTWNYCEYKNKAKIMDKKQNNNNTQPSDIHLAQIIIKSKETQDIYGT
jgi:hypothetical protein